MTARDMLFKVKKKLVLSVHLRKSFSTVYHLGIQALVYPEVFLQVAGIIDKITVKNISSGTVQMVVAYL